MSTVRTIKSAAAKCSISYLFLMRAHVPAVAVFTTACIQNCCNFFATGCCDVSRQSETKTNTVYSTSRTLPPSYVNYPGLPWYTTMSHFDSAPKLSKVMAKAEHVVAAQWQCYAFAYYRTIGAVPPFQVIQSAENPNLSSLPSRR